MEADPLSFVPGEDEESETLGPSQETYVPVDLEMGGSKALVSDAGVGGMRGLRLRQEQERMPSSTHAPQVPLRGTHAERRKAARVAHGDEIKRLETKEWATAAYALGLVITQTIVAYSVADRSLLFAWALAAGVGAFINHGLWTLIHDMGHGLAFQAKELNMVGVCMANMPHLVPTGVEFVYWHRKHHANLNDRFLDPDYPSEWEARLFGGTPWGKAFWMFFNPVMQAIRLRRFTRPRSSFVRGALVFNVVGNLAYAYVLYVGGGGTSLWYAAWSSLFAVGGLHPLSARWIAEHYHASPPGAAKQETYSYYGALNQIIFNIGYHNEHHDHPTIPWSNLPAVKAAASEYYLPLKTHTSYTRLLLAFITDPRYELDGVSRKTRGSDRRAAGEIGEDNAVFDEGANAAEFTQ